MPPHRITFGQLMVMIAILGVVFAVSPAPHAIAFAVLLLALGGISALVRVHWFRIAAWAFACYPLLVLAAIYVTWWAVWYAQGHPPRFALDDPKIYGPLVSVPYAATEALIVGLGSALLILIILAVIEFFRAHYNSQDDLRGFSIWVALPMLSWPLAWVWFCVDPGDALGWIFDF
jgi:hypothetical protein